MFLLISYDFNLMDVHDYTPSVGFHTLPYNFPYFIIDKCLKGIRIWVVLLIHIIVPSNKTKVLPPRGSPSNSNEVWPTKEEPNFFTFSLSNFLSSQSEDNFSLKSLSSSSSDHQLLFLSLSERHYRRATHWTSRSDNRHPILCWSPLSIRCLHCRFLSIAICSSLSISVLC